MAGGVQGEEVEVEVEGASRHQVPMKLPDQLMAYMKQRKHHGIGRASGKGLACGCGKQKDMMMEGSDRLSAWTGRLDGRAGQQGFLLPFLLRGLRLIQAHVRPSLAFDGLTSARPLSCSAPFSPPPLPQTENTQGHCTLQLKR